MYLYYCKKSISINQDLNICAGITIFVTYWLNMSCLKLDLEQCFTNLRLCPLMFDLSASYKNWLSSSLSMPFRIFCTYGSYLISYGSIVIAYFCMAAFSSLVLALWLFSGFFSTSNLSRQPWTPDHVSIVQMGDMP